MGHMAVVIVILIYITTHIMVTGTELHGADITGD